MSLEVWYWKNGRFISEPVEIEEAQPSLGVPGDAAGEALAAADPVEPRVLIAKSVLSEIQSRDSQLISENSILRGEMASLSGHLEALRTGYFKELLNLRERLRERFRFDDGVRLFEQYMMESEIRFFDFFAGMPETAIQAFQEAVREIARPAAMASFLSRYDENEKSMDFEKRAKKFAKMHSSAKLVRLVDEIFDAEHAKAEEVQQVSEALNKFSARVGFRVSAQSANASVLLETRVRELHDALVQARADRMAMESKLSIEVDDLNFKLQKAETENILLFNELDQLKSKIYAGVKRAAKNLEKSALVEISETAKRVPVLKFDETPIFTIEQELQQELPDQDDMYTELPPLVEASPSIQLDFATSDPISLAPTERSLKFQKTAVTVQSPPPPAPEPIFVPSPDFAESQTQTDRPLSVRQLSRARTPMIPEESPPGTELTATAAGVEEVFLDVCSIPAVILHATVKQRITLLDRQEVPEEIPKKKTFLKPTFMRPNASMAQALRKNLEREESFFKERENMRRELEETEKLKSLILDLAKKRKPLRILDRRVLKPTQVYYKIEEKNSDQLNFTLPSHD